MKKTLKKYNFVIAPICFIALPLLFLALGDVPRRTLLKESISIITILAFFMMLGQFYLARSNGAVQVFKMGKVLKVHKFIGYVFVALLLIHPFLIVAPRYFEAGVDPIDAFVIMLKTFDSMGIILGMCAWCFMLILGLTSLIRNKIGLKYKTWRTIHGILSVVFIVLASWHAIDLGRHTNAAMSIYIIIVAAIGVLLLVKTYFSKMKTVGE